jgi:hypothetical protein
LRSAFLLLAASLGSTFVFGELDPQALLCVGNPL